MLKDQINQWMKWNDPKKAQEYFITKMAFTMGPAELNSEIKHHADSINIIDVRREEDFLKGHIPGAKNLPEDRWDSLVGLEKEKINIIYCYSQQCHLAAKAATQFAKLGFHVMEMEGGFNTWKEYKLKVEA